MSNNYKFSGILPPGVTLKELSANPELDFYQLAPARRLVASMRYPRNSSMAFLAYSALAFSLALRPKDTLQVLRVFVTVVRLRREPIYSVATVFELLQDLRVIPFGIVCPSSLDSLLRLFRHHQTAE